MLRAGADKVSVNTAAVNDPSLVHQGATHFGRQCIVIAIDAKRWQPPRVRRILGVQRKATTFAWGLTPAGKCTSTAVAPPPA